MKIFKSILTAELYCSSAISYIISLFSLAPAFLVCLYGIVIIINCIEAGINHGQITPANILLLILMICTVIFALLLVLIFIFVGTLSLSGAIYLTIDLIKNRQRKNKEDSFGELTVAESEEIKSNLVIE